MNDMLTIRSTSDSFRLILGPWDQGRGYEQSYIVAELEGPGLRARTKAFAPRTELFPLFFDDLAAQPNGWRGSKEWISVESELALSCTFVKTGHVCLRAVLTQEGWKAAGSLDLEVGQLPSIAAEARRVFGTSAAT